MSVLTGQVVTGRPTSADVDASFLEDHPGLTVDTGCDVAPACLACPLPKCRYDMSGSPAKPANDRRSAPTVPHQPDLPTWGPCAQYKRWARAFL